MKKLAEEKKRNEDKERRKFKEIDPSLVVRTTKFLGAGTFGSCYLAFYRDMVVAVKEFKERKNVDLAHLRSEVRHEATMIKHLKDHRGVPLLLGIITKSEPIRLVTKFHGNKNKGLTLHKAIKKETLEKPTWLEIKKETYRGVKPHSFVWYSSQRREEQQRGNGATKRRVESCDHRFWESSFLVRSQAGDVHVHPSTGEVSRTISTHCLRNCQREWQAECPI